MYILALPELEVEVILVPVIAPPLVIVPITSKLPLLFKVAVRVKVPLSVLLTPYPKLNIPPVPFAFESPTKFI